MQQNSKDSLGDRMKNYEKVFRFYLPCRIPLILRLDGAHFHTYTKSCQKPLDPKLISVMDQVTIKLCQEIEGAVVAYAQSDEISILVHNYKTLQTQPWFDNQVQKICSVSASIAASKMTALSSSVF